MTMPVHAGYITLISRDATGMPGSSDSGISVSSAAIPEVSRRSPVIDDGSVIFLSKSRLDPAADTNNVIDIYRRLGDELTVIDLPETDIFNAICAAPANNNAYWIATDNAGLTRYRLRQTNPVFEDNRLKNQLDVSTLTASGRVGLICEKEVESADFSGSATIAVFSQRIGSVSHIRVHDVTNPTTIENVTVDTGSDDDSAAPAISDDGTSIVFASDATDSIFVGSGDNGVRDIFLRRDGTFTLISQRTGSPLGSGDAITPDISGDGQIICFTSTDATGAADLFIWDGAAVTALDIPGHFWGGVPSAPRLNYNGRFVVFSQRPRGPDSVSQIYIFDRQDLRFELISATSERRISDRDCFAPEISPDGRYVTFVSTAANLDAAVTAENTSHHVYLVDRLAPRSHGITVAAETGEPRQFTPAGQTAIGFGPPKFQVVQPPQTGNLSDVNGVAIDTATVYDSTSLPWSYTGSADDHFDFVTVDSNDRRSAASRIQILVVEPAHGRICRISEGNDDSETSGESFDLQEGNVDISDDGDRVIFDSTAAELGGSGSATIADIFLYQVNDGRSRHVSDNFPAGTDCILPAIAGNGIDVAYIVKTQPDPQLILENIDTLERKVIDTDINLELPALSDDGSRMVYRKDNTIRLYDRSDAGTIQSIAAGRRPAISGSGDIIAFEHDGGIRIYDVTSSSFQTGIATGDRPELSVSGRYLVYRNSGQLLIADLADAGTADNVAIDAGRAAISDDAAYIYFADASGQGIRYNTNTGEQHAVSNVNGTLGNDDTFAGRLSDDGAVAVFASLSSNLLGQNAGGADIDQNGKIDIFINHLVVTPPDIVTASVESPIILRKANGETVAEITSTILGITDPGDARFDITNAQITGSLTNAGGNPVSMSFAVSDLPLTYTAIDSDTFAQDFLHIRSALIFDSPENVSAVHTLRIFAGATIQNPVVTHGWQLISFPLNTGSELAPDDIFRKNAAPIAAGSVWQWDAGAAMMVPATTFASGRGYWLYARESGALDDIPGPLTSATTVAFLPQGWHLLGPAGSGATRDLPGQQQGVAGAIWLWDAEQNSFVTAADLTAGKGYWILSDGTKSQLDIALQ